MTTYQERVNAFIANDATVEGVTVALTIYNGFCGLSQDAIESGRIVRRWWDERGEEYAWQSAQGLAMVVMAVACLVCVTGFTFFSAAKAVESLWIRYGTLDGDGPCIGGLAPAPVEVIELDATDKAIAEMVHWCVQRWPQLAA